jgi:hypothetical protein
VSRATYNGASVASQLAGWHFNAEAVSPGKYINKDSKEENTAYCVFTNYHVNKNVVIKLEYSKSPIY